MSHYVDLINNYKKFHQTTGTYLMYLIVIKATLIQDLFDKGHKAIYLHIVKERKDGHKTFYGSQE